MNILLTSEAVRYVHPLFARKRPLQGDLLVTLPKEEMDELLRQHRDHESYSDTVIRLNERDEE